MYIWSFIAIIVLVGMTIYSKVMSKKFNDSEINEVYPIMKLNNVWNLSLFIIFVGITVLLGYYGNTAFIYGKF